jgi:hypothetical protein
VFENEIEGALHKKIEDASDDTKSKSDVCPVHRVKMQMKTVPITYGLDARNVGSLPQVIERQFPFSREDINGGCVRIDGPGFPTSGKRYVARSA